MVVVMLPVAERKKNCQFIQLHGGVDEEQQTAMKIVPP